MELAIVNGKRERAMPGVTAHCPQCHATVIAKCGEIVVHHWAHEANDCDPWSEPETPWHRDWKAVVSEIQIEVCRAGHRADIVRGNGQVVELQHSPISSNEIQEREAAYGKMVWLFDGTTIANENLLFANQDNQEVGNHDVEFQWKHPRKTYAQCRRQVYIDLGSEVLRLGRLDLAGGSPYRGWGVMRPRAVFVEWLRRDMGRSIGRAAAEWG